MRTDVLTRVLFVALLLALLLLVLLFYRRLTWSGHSICNNVQLIQVQCLDEEKVQARNVTQHVVT